RIAGGPRDLLLARRTAGQVALDGQQRVGIERTEPKGLQLSGFGMQVGAGHYASPRGGQGRSLYLKKRRTREILSRIQTRFQKNLVRSKYPTPSTFLFALPPTA